MKIYLDNCCYNRLLDDRTDPLIYFDRNSVMIILEFVEKGIFELFGSQMLLKEMEDTDDIIKRLKLKMMYSLCSYTIKVSENIAKRAVEIRDLSNIRTKDSIHLACAENAFVDAFITVDKKFKNCAEKISKVKVYSPTKWLMEVLYGQAN